MKTVFEYENHFSYLKDTLGRTNVRGIKGRFAEHVQIQPAFLSQVLANKYPLSLEQGDLANSFFDHTSEESDFFLLILSRDRAGSASLRKHFSKQIEHFRKRRLEVVERLGRKAEVPLEVQGVYYSSWLYAAVHVALTIPELRKPSVLKDYLGVKRDKVLHVLQFLEENGFVFRKGDEFHPTQTWIRLDRESPQINQLHINWRNKAIQSLDTRRDEDLHYSGAFSLDEKTATIIRDALLENISKQIKTIEAAPEEDLYVINLDFFKLKRSE